MMHLAGGGIRCATLSVYALILSRCFSQKCWIVSRIGYGSNTLMRGFVPPTIVPADEEAFRIVTLRLSGRA
uniref:Putative secreted protein n=1 Tax=Anopheles darlingi TaxID=43151 RepID=A0A2M4D613_ANODA